MCGCAVAYGSISDKDLRNWLREEYKETFPELSPKEREEWVMEEVPWNLFERICRWWKGEN